eukprot:Em0025g50a
MTNLQSSLERAKLLLSLEAEQNVAAVTPQMGTSSSHNMERLVEQVASLTEQVAALSAQSRDRREQRPVRCYNSGRLGHIRRNCHYPQQQQQENYNGVPARGNSHPARQYERSGEMKVCTEYTTSTAAGEELPILDQVSVHIKLNNLDHVHNFLVVEKLITSAILGIDFLQQQGLLLDFRTTPVTVLSPTLANAMKAEVVSHEEDAVLLKSVLANSLKGRDKTCSVGGVDDDNVNNDMVEECAIPIFSDLAEIEPPQYIQQYFEAVIREFGDLFSTQTGKTNMASHHINTMGSPVRVPARRIPVHFREEIEKMLMNTVMRGLPFVTSYIDDVLIHSPNEEAHKQHLTDAFKRLRQTGLTLRGTGMAPDNSKVQAVQNWSKPNDMTAVKQFLGLASYNRRYIMNFADIARPPWGIPNSEEKTDRSTYPSIPKEYNFKIVQLYKEYNFKIVYRKGTLNSNADALSRLKRSIRELTPVSTAATGMQTKVAILEIQLAQQNNEVTLRLFEALDSAQKDTCGDGNLHLDQQQRLTVSILPKSLQQKALLQCHDSPGAGHQGFKKTLELRRMSKVPKLKIIYAKQSTTHKGRPWQMVARDILQVPLSTHNNKYLLVIQDYFTKWADAIPLQNQRAATISAEMVKVFSTYEKLDPHWNGRWSVKSVKTPLTLEITDGVKTKEPSGRVLQESHPNREAPQIDHLEMPAITFPSPVHHEPKIFKTMLRYSLFSLSIRNWVKFLKKMLQLTSSIQQRKEDILNESDVLQKDTRLARVELFNKRDECSDYVMSL